MSIDVLQEKIRKLKNPSVIDFTAVQIPTYLSAEEGSDAAAYKRFCTELLDGLSEIVPVARFHVNLFAMYGAAGMDAMAYVLQRARDCGYYILLDMPGFASPAEAEFACKRAFAGNWQFDGQVLQPYLGTDGMKSFVTSCLDAKKTVFFLARTPNKSAADLQDLLTGSRVVHQTVVETAKRLGNHAFGRCHYNEVGALVSATAPSGIRSLRRSFPELFFLMDGLDAVGGNASNCSHGFDRVGHGAAACASASVTNAWITAEADEKEYVSCAKQAAERMKKNLTRYVTIL